jgi:(S)-sulfolactate dehydrogenase
MRVVIPEFMDEAAVDALRRRFEVVFDASLVQRRPELLRDVGAAHGLIVRNRTRVDKELLEAAPMLTVVGRLGVGLDNIDLTACEARRIEVIPARGANALAVAEYVIAVSLILLRGAFLATDAVAAGSWPREAFSGGREVAGRTLGIVGFGSIGQVTARLARGLGMEVIAFDAEIDSMAPLWIEQQVTPRGLDELLREADVVSLHVPLTPKTRHLIDAGRLALMKPGAVLVNTARGGIVEEAALASMLRAGRLAGAALDVFEMEPLQAASPLAGCPNLLLTPHIAGVTRESNLRVSTLIADRVAAALEARGKG